MHITSKENSRLKIMTALHSRKGVEKHQCFLLEGLRSFQHAVENHGDIQWIVLEEKAAKKVEYQDILNQYEDKILVMDKELFSLVSDTVHSQGIVIVCSLPKWNVTSLGVRGFSRLLLLDSLQDPGNVGTLIRTADGAGFDAVLYTSGTVHPYTPKVSRCAMGSNIYLPIIKTTDEELEILQKSGWQLVATALDESAIAYKEAKWSEKVILALGNEGNGLRSKLMEQAKIKITIPLYGKAESLNVSAAGAILMYDIVGRI